MSDQLSLQVSRALDDLGYNEETRKFRIDRYDEENFVKSFCSQKLVYQVMLAGSKAEGTSKFSESDFDYLYIYSGVKATESADIVDGDSDLTLVMEEDAAPPGYCRLRFLQCGEGNHGHQVFLEYNCYVAGPGYTPYLSTASVLHLHSLQMCHNTKRCGPSNKGQRPGGRECDNVPAIRCAHMPHTLKTWVRRHQNHQWPERQLMEEIARSHIFLVPVGMHGTEQQHLQWRVSFNVPEKLLIQNFTAVQNKIYILLKMIKNEVIQPKCPESITSYIVKTIMLWTVEQIPAEMWSERKLVDLLIHTLYKLYRCVQCGMCPMYFIPGCNILHGRVTRTTLQIICSILSVLLSDKISCILRLPTIQTKLAQYMFVPLAFGKFNKDQKEKTDIVLNKAKHVHIRGMCTITDRSKLLCCLQGQDTVPYRDLLTELVSVPTSAGSERNKLVKYIFSQTLSQLAMQKFVDATAQSCSNIYKYTKVRKCMKILYGKRHSDVLCGRVRLAQVFCMLGQYNSLRDVLFIGADKIKYYMSKFSWRDIIQMFFYNERLAAVCGSECLSISQVLQHFCLPDIWYDYQMEMCLPKALQYEVYKSCDGERESVTTDAEPMLYYLQYLSYKQLRQTNKANVAFTNLVWCSTRPESNIEYREVALNILGHCLLKKRLYDKAVRVLAKSIMFSKNHSHLHESFGFKTNAAVWHIAILLSRYLKHTSRVVY